MKLKYLVFVLVVILLFILASGCQSGGNSNVNYNFKQGFGEVELKLLDKAPPAKIYPLSSFRIIAEVSNQAAYDVTGGELRIVGLDPKYFTIDPTEQSVETLAGKSLTSPLGDKAFLEFEGQSGELIESAVEYPANYYLKLKYHSLMEFSDSVCINPNFYDVYDSGCVVQDKKSFGGQGAPLAIVSLEEVMSPAPNGAVELRFTLRNRGKGKVGQINLGRTQLGNDPLTCELQDVGGDKRSVRFTENKPEAVLICRHTLVDQNSYVTTIALDFTYDYEIEQQQKLLLVK